MHLRDDVKRWNDCYTEYLRIILKFLTGRGRVTSFNLTVHIGTVSSRNSVAVSALTIYHRGSVQYGGIRMEILMTVRKIASICTMVRSWDSAFSAVLVRCGFVQWALAAGLAAG